jgi:hypothetical protein
MKKYCEENKYKLKQNRKKYNEKNIEKLTTRRKKHYQENRERLLENDKKYREKLSDSYLLQCLHNQIKIPTNELKKHTELIEVKRLQIKIHRLIESKKQTT